MLVYLQRCLGMMSAKQGADLHGAHESELPSSVSERMKHG